MKTKKHSGILKVASGLLVVLTLSAFIVLAANVGSAEDPLVTLSYLEHTFLDKIMAQVDSKLETRETELAGQLEQQAKEAGQRLEEMTPGGSTGTAASTYVTVTLQKGQALTGGVGTEIMLCSGTATCVAGTSPGLIDMSGGKVLESGQSLAGNHLYMVTTDGRGAKATSATVKLLVRGSYTTK